MDKETPDVSSFIPSPISERIPHLPTIQGDREEQGNADHGFPSDSFDEDEFDFSFGSELEDSVSFILADHLFTDGRIRPEYPRFDRNLVTEFDDDLDPTSRKTSLDQRKRDEDEEEEEEGIQQPSSTPDPNSYCVWKPGMSTPTLNSRKKYRSFALNTSKSSRLKDFVFGRSLSDINKSSSTSRPPEKERKDKEEENPVAVAEEDTEKKKKNVVVPEKKKKKNVIVPEKTLSYNGGKDRKPRSYLPYRTDLVGFRPF